MANIIGHFYGKVVSFWELRPQTPTGASPLEPTGGFCSTRK